MKILTIAIPTYNRAKYLDICLNNIFTRNNLNYKDIEFIVSDNNSSDDTETIVREYIKKGFDINYIKNQKNIGPDNNFIQCFNLANGKYFWLIGDDDIVVDGAIERILKVLKTNEECGIVFLNSYPFLNDYKKEMPNLNKDGFIIYNSIDEFLSKASYFLTFISTTIVNKRLALKDIEIESMKDTNLIQLSWTFNALFNSKKNIFIKYYSIAAKSGNTGGYQLCRVFGYNLQKVFDIYQNKGVNPKYFKIIKNKMLITFFPASIIRAKNQMFKGENENFFKTLYPLYKNYPYFWLFTVPAILLPSKVSYMIYTIANYLRRIKRILSI